MQPRTLISSPVAALTAAAITFGLFFAMQAMIYTERGEPEPDDAAVAIEFVRLKRESELRLKKRRKPKRQQAEEEPPPPELQLERAKRPPGELGGITAIYDPTLQLAGLELGSLPVDSDVVPMVRISAQYPPRAFDRGIEGWVKVSFNITAAGTVEDAVVTAYEPSTIFNRAALRAVRKWKYRPKIVNGVAVAREGIETRFTFAIEE